MLYYEFRKILSKTGSRVALLALLVLFGVTCYFAVYGYGTSYTDEQGVSRQGIRQVRKLREARMAWEGPLTEEKIAAVIRKHAAVIATPEYNSKDVTEMNIAYSWTQDYQDIRQMICRAFGEFRSYDYYKIDSLSPEDAADFYPNRIRALRAWLDTEAKDMYTEEEKEFLLGRYEQLETPFYYTWHLGWDELFEYGPTIQMIFVLVMSFVTAGIFAGEFSNRADAVFFTSYHGRKKAVTAKLWAGVLLSAALYWIVWGLYSAVVLGALGADGASCQIQVRVGWKSFYNITYGQLYLLMSFGGFLGSLFLLLLNMLVSAWTRSAVIAVTAPFIMIFIPSFLSNLSVPWLSKLLGLLPDQLLQMQTSVNYFNLYGIGGRITGEVEPLFALYGALSLLLLPAVCALYRRAGRG